MQITIKVQHEDYSVQAETDFLRAQSSKIGAVVTFSGLVRDLDAGTQIKGLFLEHYPGMTEKSLHKLATEATQRWPLTGITVIHRIGELLVGEQIVFVGVTSAHRKAAFSACEFLMDFLKTQAPFWKKCLQAEGEFWVAAKESDSEASERW